MDLWTYERTHPLIEIQRPIQKLVLGCRSPPNDESNEALPRCWRTTLFRPRSGFRRSLNGARPSIKTRTPPARTAIWRRAQRPIHLCAHRSHHPTRRLSYEKNPLHADHIKSRTPLFFYQNRLPGKQQQQQRAWNLPLLWIFY